MIGIMQGRLSKPRSSLIQEFPWESWREEFSAAHKIGISIIEWTVDHSRFLENPIFRDEMTFEINPWTELISSSAKPKNPDFEGPPPFVVFPGQFLGQVMRNLSN